jgi:hypothetical protein
MAEIAKTKRVRITLAALTRVEYTEEVEVPVAMTEAELDEMVDRRYAEVDGGKYEDDGDYWERAQSTGWELVEGAKA